MHVPSFLHKPVSGYLCVRPWIYTDPRNFQVLISDIKKKKKKKGKHPSPEIPLTFGQFQFSLPLQYLPHFILLANSYHLLPFLC